MASVVRGMPDAVEGGKCKFSKYILAGTAFSRVVRDGLIGPGGKMVTSDISFPYSPHVSARSL